ncbi:MAG: hypothetical protein JXR96_21995 [Deltaproteobacteria bacterium]|nr:hypothetical protein [Deltaproteobacteria bacterium]
MHRTAVCVSILAAALTARAYGPMTHCREITAAAERLASSGEVAGLEDLAASALADPALHAHLMLGAILPDMREAVDGLGFDTHSRPFARHLLGVAGDPGRDIQARAVALGAASHVCSDIAAQVFCVSYFVQKAPLGATDLLIGYMDDRPDGENELWVEGALDIFCGDAQLLFALYDYFQPDPPEPVRLDRALDVWLGEAAAFFGPEHVGDADAIKRQIGELLSSLDEQLSGDNRLLLLLALDTVRAYDLADTIRMAESMGLLDVLVSYGYEVELDSAELDRLQQEAPFFGQEGFFEDYSSWIVDLGVGVLVESAAGAAWLENWPVWRAEPLAASTVISLAHLAGPLFAGRSDLGVFDLGWEDGEGEPVTEIDPADPPGRLRLFVDLFPLDEAEGAVRVGVRKAVPGYPYEVGPLLAEREIDIGGWSPLDWGGQSPQRVELELELDPDGLEAAEGLHAEIRSADGRVAFSTAWDGVFDCIDWPMDRPVYTSQFDTYSRFPASLRVEPVVDDTQPPQPPEIALSAQQLSADRPELEISFSASDLGSGICGYRLQLGTAPGAADLLAERAIEALGLDRTGTFAYRADLALLDSGGELFATARAIDCAGLASEEARAGPVRLGQQPDGCGCGQAPRPAAGLVWLTFFVFVYLRRRRAGSISSDTHPPRP